MNLEDVKLFVATPMYGGMCTGTYAVGLANMVGMTITNNIKMHYSFMMNESLITRARDSIAYDFLQSDCTHLMFIDADIGFNPYDIPAMLVADKDIIAGVYPKKEINWHKVEKAVTEGIPTNELQNHTGEFAVRLKGNKSQTGRRDEPLEVEYAATGFMIIKREVLEGLKDKVPTYTSDMYTAMDIERKPKTISQLFDTSIDPVSNNLLSEDYHFCYLAQQHDYRIFIAPWAKLSHTGTFVFNGGI
jgi:hypothetical protein